MASGNENKAFDGGEKEEKSIPMGVKDAPKTEQDAKQIDQENPTETSTPHRRRIMVEPALACAFMFQIACFSLTSQYTYYAIGERHNLSSLLEAEGSGVNGTEDGNMCNVDPRERNSTAFDAQQRAQAETARFNFYMDVVTDVPGFIVLLFFGTLIDVLGRKPGLIISMLGMIFRIIIYISQQFFQLPLEILFISGVVEALTGGFITFVTSCYALLVDTLAPNERGKRMAFADAANGFCVGLMSFLMGLMIESWGFMWPLFVVLAGHLINLVYIIFFIVEARKPTSHRKSISPKYIIDSFKVPLRKRPNNGRLLLGLLVTSWIFMYFSKVGTRSLDSLYKLNYPFCWSPTTLGAVSGVGSVVMNFAQIAIAVFLLKPIGNIGVIYLGMSSMAADNLITGIATESWMLYVAPIAGSAAGVASPFMRGVMSSFVPVKELGGLFASLSAMEKVLGIGASSFYNFVYGATLYVYSGTVFLIMSALMIIALLLVIVQSILSKKENKIKEAEPSEGDWCSDVVDGIPVQGVESTKF